MARSRLLARLDVGVRGRVTLISAGAGFGKTTLLSTWCATRTQPLAWVDLDRGDNDPVRFWTYVIAALQTVVPAGTVPPHLALPTAPPPPHAAAPPSLETVLTELLNGLARALTHDTVLVLDDYHEVSNPTIHEMLGFVIDHLPPRLHLLITSRSDSPLPLARLRARGDVTELSTADLRFALDEAATLLAEGMGITLECADLENVHRRTEGWAAGLYLAGLALRGAADPHAAVQAFQGSSRAVVDYFAEEVLRYQSEERQRFLLQTAILEELSAPLCDAVCDMSGSAALLDALARDNVFVSVLDEQCQCYQYHRLFADFLRARLRQLSPDQEPALHRRAAAWYAAHQRDDQALWHWLAAGDTDAAAAQIEAVADVLLWERGEATTLHGWLHALPAALLHARPRLGLAYAWTLTFGGDLALATTWLDTLEQHHATADPHIQGELAAVRARLARLRNDAPAAIAHGQQALALLPPHFTRLRAELTMSVGSFYCLSGQTIAAAPIFDEARLLSLQAGQLRTAMIATWHRVDILRHLGELHAGREVCQQMQDHLDRLPTRPAVAAAGAPGVALATLHYEWNHLPEALRLVQHGIEQGLPGGEVEVLLPGYLTLARIQWARGEVGAAWAALHEAEQLARTYSLHWLQDQVALTRIQIHLAHHDTEHAMQTLARRGVVVDWAAARLTLPDVASHLEREGNYLGVARVLLALERCDMAYDLLAQLLAVARSEGRHGDMIVLLLLQAVALAAGGDTRAAGAPLTEALTLAEPQGFVRSFVNEGAPLHALLTQGLTEQVWMGTLAAYARRLLAAWDGAAPTAAPAALVEPLSAREQEVLRLLAAGQSNQAIAEQLIIAPSTVRTHLKHLYAKLGTSGRVQAVVRAQEYGLL
jgi:LuxR family maltose regulon positive regulatory protein